MKRKILSASARIQNVQTPIIPVIGEMIRTHPGTISLGQGVVYYDPPPGVAEYAAAAMADPVNHRYQPVEGIDALRAVLVDKLNRENKIDCADSTVVVTAGSNMGFFNAILAICDVGDEVILLTPWYFNHEMAIRIAGCQPMGVATDADFQPDIASIEAKITNKTRAIVTISPNNPTGAVYTPDILDAVNALCAERGIYHISDEAYEYFVYGDVAHHSPASRKATEDHTISLFSLSKSYSLASWRIGYMVIPDHLAESVRKIQDTNVICPPVISQYAALHALKSGYEYCRPMIKRIADVRQHLYQALEDVPGIAANHADGAFYVFLEIPGDNRIDIEIVSELVKDFGVAAIPGSAFGIESGTYLRVSYGALEPDAVKRGIDCLCDGLRSIVTR